MKNVKTNLIDLVIFNKNPFLYQLNVVSDEPCAEQIKTRSSLSRNGDFCLASNDCKIENRQTILLFCSLASIV